MNWQRKEAFTTSSARDRKDTETLELWQFSNLEVRAHGLGQHSEEDESRRAVSLGRHGKADLENGGKLRIHCACVPSRFSHVWLFVIPWTVSRQASLSMGFSRQEYWSGLPRSPPGDLSNPGIVLASLVSHPLADGFVTTSPTWEAHKFTVTAALGPCS